MRLDVLEHGHRRPARIFKRLVALVIREELDDVIKTAMHRPEFFGRWFSGYVHEVLRGPSFWTAGERECIAAATSRLNECPFCATAHTETMRVASRGEVDADDPSVMRPELAATLELIAKVTGHPDQVTGADVDTVRAAGVPDDAIVDALHVNLIFNLVNRLANAFGWSWDSESHVRRGAKALHLTRYKLPGFLLR